MDSQLTRWKREHQAPAHTCADRPRLYCAACGDVLDPTPPQPFVLTPPAPTINSTVLPPAQGSAHFGDLGVDLLTNLQATRAFLQELEETVKQAKPITLIQADLDKFQALNIAHGHEVGDELLRAIGDIFRRSCRPLGNRCVGPCRFGGESFALALIDMENEVALDLAEGIREWIASLRPSVTARFVVVTGVSEMVDMLRLAHSVLYPHPDLKVPNSVTSRLQGGGGGPALSP